MNEIRRATDDRTRAYYAETLPNPKLTVFPIAEVAAIGRSFGIPLVMDNTAAPILARPFEHGGGGLFDDQISRWARTGAKLPQASSAAESHHLM